GATEKVSGGAPVNERVADDAETTMRGEQLLRRLGPRGGPVLDGSGCRVNLRDDRRGALGWTNGVLQAVIVLDEPERRGDTCGGRRCRPLENRCNNARCCGCKLGVPHDIVVHYTEALILVRVFLGKHR